MNRINVLDTNIANMIAAGEVVERPSSVVKELVENSIDAGAKNVLVEIKNGGMSYIRVTDDGHGIEPDDVVKAFLRHATSKIQKREDLDSIYTLGFRGEALASIAAVACVEIHTKTKNSDMGRFVRIEGGKVTEEIDMGCANGTTIIVKNLFFNTPARMKFLKKDSTETAYINDVIGKMILGNPSVAFKLINSGKNTLRSPGSGKLSDAVFSVYGNDYVKHMIGVNEDMDGIKVTGFVGDNTLVRGNRSMQIFYINGRNIQSKIMSQAIAEAYKNSVMQGKFPVCVLNVSLSTGLVDVNVHPTKMEVRFSDDRKIFSAVYGAVKAALSATRTVPQMEFKKASFEKTVPNETYRDAEQTNINLLRDSFIKTDTVRPQREETSFVSKPQEVVSNKETAIPFKNIVETPKVSYDSGKPMVTRDRSGGGTTYTKFRETLVPMEYTARAEEKTENVFKTVFEENPVVINEPVYEETETNSEIETAPQVDITQKANEEIPSYRIVGQVFDTYIIVESQGEMVLIDQHAAHERMHFERLKKELYEDSFKPQMLLSPIVVNLSAVEYTIAADNTELFSRLGFELDIFGESAVILRALPFDMPEHDAKTLVEEILGSLADAKTVEGVDRFEKALHTVACKKAIKGNRHLTDMEMESLVEDVFKLGTINTCPHGRPICVKMTKYEIEKQFKRIV